MSNNLKKLLLYIFDSPLDEGWEFLPKADAIANQLAIEVEHDNSGMQNWLTLEEFTKNLRRAKQLFLESSWGFDDIDRYYSVRVLWFPSDNGELEYAFLTKTSNNGTTAIATTLDLDKWRNCFERH